MINEKRIKELMKGIEDLENRPKASVIKELMTKYKLSESTAAVYYGTWRHMFMQEGAKLKVEIKKRAKTIGPEQIKKIKEDMKASPKLVETVESKPAILVANEIKTGICRGLLNMKGFIPKTFEGKYFTYKVGKDKLEIEDGQVTSVSKECIEEQTRALNLYNAIKNFKEA